MDKRTFLKLSGTALALSPFYNFSIGKNSKSSLNVLMLGGRGFIGPTIIDTFLKAGHKVTILNRGITNPHLFTDLPFIRADREKEDKRGLKELIKATKKTTWDIVIDTWQKSPKSVADMLEVLDGKYEHYHYISSVAVYADWGVKYNSEKSALKKTPPFPSKIAIEQPYSYRKTLAENSIIQNLNGNYTTYRSHGMRAFSIYDPVDEPYWPARFHNGGDIILPKAAHHNCQVTDVVSLINFLLYAAENKVTGAFNVAYPTFSFESYVKALSNVTSSKKTLHWIDEKFLKAEGIRPYKDLPMWKPVPEGSYYFDVSKAIKNGLKNRSLDEMVKDQTDGYVKRNPKLDFKFSHPGTITRERELAILKKWENQILQGKG